MFITLAKVTFECLTCHTLVWNPDTVSYEFAPFRDCLLCHQQIPGQASVHHLTAPALTRDCAHCHGDFVNNVDDGHDVPTYAPSLVTPWPGPVYPVTPGDTYAKPNPGPNGEGQCTFCHNTGTGSSTPGIDPGGGAMVYTTQATHLLRAGSGW